MTYRINVRPLVQKYPDQILHFHNVESYEILDGLVIFVDTRTKQTKRFAVSNVEIEEEAP